VRMASQSQRRIPGRKWMSCELVHGITIKLDLERENSGRWTVQERLSALSEEVLARST
jgi:hypothetical protein